MGQGARWVPGPGHVEVPTRGCAPVAGRSLPAPPRADSTGGTSRFVAVVKARPRPLVSSALARTEVLRALLGEGPEATGRAHALLGRIDLLRISDRVLGLPGTLLPPISALWRPSTSPALQLGTDLGSLVSYDQRLLDAARSLGITITSPR